MVALVRRDNGIERREGPDEAAASCRCVMADDIISGVSVLSRSGKTMTWHRRLYGTWPTGETVRFRVAQEVTA